MITRIYIIEDENNNNQRFAVIVPFKDPELHDNKLISNLNPGEKIVDTLKVRDGGSWVQLHPEGLE
jgi:calcineurin-like phosphoesterase family protein